MTVEVLLLILFVLYIKRPLLLFRTGRDGGDNVSPGYKTILNIYIINCAVDFHLSLYQNPPNQNACDWDPKQIRPRDLKSMFALFVVVADARRNAVTQGYNDSPFSRSFNTLAQHHGGPCIGLYPTIALQIIHKRVALLH